MSTHSEGKNTHPATCRDCGQALGAGQGVVFSVYGYPWDGSDGEGSITVELERYTLCYNATECAERIVERSTNVRALRQVAADSENCSFELRARARRALADIAQLARDRAVSDDLAAREMGYGAIGRGVA